MKTKVFACLRYLSLLLGTAMFFASCEKEVKIDLNPSEPSVVVEGAIETHQPPYVILSTTLGFFSSVNLSTVENFFIHNAEITVSDGSKTIALKEYALDTGRNARFYIYTVDTTSPTNIMLGEEEKYYTLTIKYGGKTYTSTTKIPHPKGLDTLWFDKPSFVRSKTPKDALELYANYTDPDTLGNHVRYFTRRNHEGFYAAGAFTDEVVNGKFISSIDLYAGFEDSVKANQDSLIYFYKGDTVTVKWAGIDKKVYNFWNTYEFALRSGGNPFSSPINVKTNISNGALGVWSGYGSIYYTLVVK